MSTPADRLPTWGTKGTVDTGPDTGLSTRLEPSVADKANGYVADQAIAARVDNWLKGVTLDWLAHLAPIQLKNWTKDICAVKGTSITTGYVNPGGVRTPTGWLLPGSDGTSDDGARVFFTPGAAAFDGDLSDGSILTVPGCVQVLTMAYEPSSGTVLLGVKQNSGTTDTVVYTMGESGGGLTKVVLSASAGNAGRVVYESTSGRFLAFDEREDGWQTGKRYYHSTDSGATWTEHTISGAATGHDIQCVEAAAGKIVLTLADSIYILVSSDGGDTWVQQSTSGSAGVVGVCYTGNGWRAIDYAGQVYNQFGGLWIPFGTPLAGVTTGETANKAQDGTTSIFMYGNHMASDGSRAVVVTFATDSRGVGVYWSQDYGQTWHTEYLSHGLDNLWKVRGVLYSGGEFLLMTREPDQASAFSGTAVYRSLRL